MVRNRPPMKPSGVQLIMAMVPPGRHTRRISSAVCWWCGANMAPTTERTTSNSPSRNGSASTSASTHSRRTPAAVAARSPAARSSGVRSEATTVAPVRAAGIDALPEPAATSSTELALVALAARFWPDTDEPGGRASLRSAVWTLRRAVGDEALVATRSALGLAPDTVSVDLHEIATLAARGDLVEAVALCGGEALPDIDEDWALEARAEHRARHAALLDQLAESAEAAGDVAGAVRWSRLRSALDPLDEPAHVTLMRRL